LQDRYKVIDKELDDTKVENIELKRQIKLQSHQAEADSSMSLDIIRANNERD
jgi:hypothetical protein